MGFTYSNNAQVLGDFLYVRDISGNIIPGRQVNNGDSITVIDVSYSKQLVLVEYPTSSGVATGYVTNATSIIKYFRQGDWKNGSTPEAVLDENGNVIGSISPSETATILYKKNDLTCIVYNTDKGQNTKSGYVKYSGSTISGNESDSGTLSNFTYPNNAQVVGDFLYVRDASGNIIPGRQVDNGDNITVLDVSYSKQLALVEYPTASGIVRNGYVNNATSIIKYYHEGDWRNGSTSESVLDESGNVIGSLDPYETATVLYRKNGLTHVVYNTSSGKNTKSGYVRYAGSSSLSGFTYPNNAQVVGDFLYVRDSNGNIISGKQINIGDNITVLDVSYSKQLVFVQYQASTGVATGYVTNATSVIQYYNHGDWKNGSTPEAVLDENGNVIGSISPYETATILYKKNGLTCIVYDTDKGINTKSGYVKYSGEYIPNNLNVPSDLGLPVNGQLRKVFIDAGHGGYDSGAIGNGIKEKDIVLQISLAQKALFESYGYVVKLSRSTDEYKSLSERTNEANFWGADLFISNHINAGGGAGSEVWCSINGGAGRVYAENIAKKLGTVFLNRGVKTQRGEHGDYLHVIRESRMPAVLIEHGFIDNLLDAQILKNTFNIQKLAQLTFEAITNIDLSAPAILPIALTDAEKRENNRYIADLFGVKGILKFERKYTIISDANLEITYKLSEKSTIGNGDMSLKIENGKFGATQDVLTDEIGKISLDLLKKNMDVELVTELAKCDTGTFSVKLKMAEIIPMPKVSFIAEFKYDVINNGVIEGAVYHTIEITIKSPDFWKKVAEGIMAMIVILFIIISLAPEAAALTVITGTGELAPIIPLFKEIIERAESA